MKSTPKTSQKSSSSPTSAHVTFVAPGLVGGLDGLGEDLGAQGRELVLSIRAGMRRKVTFFSRRGGLLGGNQGSSGTSLEYVWDSCFLFLAGG